jgi:hypothetical protein
MSQGGSGGKVMGTVLFIGAIVVFDVLSYAFGWGWILY